MRQLMSKEQMQEADDRAVCISAMDGWPYLVTMEVRAGRRFTAIEYASVLYRLTAALERQRRRISLDSRQGPYIRSGIRYYVWLEGPGQAGVQIDPHVMAPKDLARRWPAIIDALMPPN
ncbi:hypothetical protein [Bordetella genomosp. 11]|uniref:Uncharacterized protein n=1 Tax=Bordetella genomosp. 11 TaxID=1416808 RepID=A0A261UJ52_9BORD|nr:hypothetical protein [Bordetella genomosp. 11]OZI61577.1 hypothetical protein CAL28_20045 [Bordetella genomosp. 11]